MDIQKILVDYIYVKSFDNLFGVDNFDNLVSK